MYIELHFISGTLHVPLALLFYPAQVDSIMSNKPHDTPTKATAEGGEVMLDGPAGLAMSFTPHAAAKSAAALAKAATKAGRQTPDAQRAGTERPK